jgi:hypothetical protein
MPETTARDRIRCPIKGDPDENFSHVLSSPERSRTGTPTSPNSKESNAISPMGSPFSSTDCHPAEVIVFGGYARHGVITDQEG